MPRERAQKKKISGLTGKCRTVINLLYRRVLASWSNTEERETEILPPWLIAVGTAVYAIILLCLFTWSLLLFRDKGYPSISNFNIK